MKLYSFKPTEEKSIDDFLKQEQDGLSPSVHKGFLTVTYNIRKDFFDMNFVKTKDSVMFMRAISYAPYPNTKKEVFHIVKPDGMTEEITDQQKTYILNKITEFYNKHRDTTTIEGIKSMIRNL